MKSFIHLLTLALLTFSFQLFGQDPCDGIDADELVCAELKEGFVLPIPMCDALTLGLTIVDCEDFDFGTTGDGTPIDECDCDWTADDFVCITMAGSPDVYPVHACDIECGFFDVFFEFEIVDCGELELGCTDPNALNFSPTATLNDGSCEYDNEGDCDCDWNSDEMVCVDFGWGEIAEIHACEIECFGDWLGEEYEIIDCENLVYGCTDPSAENYDETANVNDGSCEYVWNDECDCDWNSDEMVCVDFGWGEIAEIHACEIECFGDWFGEEFEIIDCENLVYGCTDPSAENYDETANVNDWSCEYGTEEDCDCDWNTSEFVCVDFGDGQIGLINACELECFGDWFGDFEVVDCDTEIEDIDVDNLDEEIQELIGDFLSEGFNNQIVIEDIIDLISLIIYPNPVDENGMGILVESSGEAKVFIQVTNSIGQVVIEENRNLHAGKNQLEIEVRDIESGIYTTTVFTNNGAKISERFIKN